ncbi:tRNA pseudouridine(38-40) synthase TruA [uncultured Clostridium sp.]|jgi:tRNA pseudouridine38-40 synthase|uniref:tRNA pseudouridine(38-40) synthase TruA n=1 Tax=uncultured Clostridium sp. TaxID=59620 RepID=UPI00261A6AA7|nr:tRNA pseudouridine(38-40) synthase TruA [uncultured Clostridium sp.]
MNYKLLLQFDGTRYLGWQKQKTGTQTIQGKIEAVLEKLFDEEVQVIGCSRTDSGVHAINYVASFKAKDMDVKKVHSYLEQYLPDDIIVKEVTEVSYRFHARYNAKSKTYIYKIDNSKYGNVFEKRYAWNIKENLNIEKMKSASELFIGTHDFKAFTNKAKNKNITRTINSIDIEQDNNMITIKINGNSFLLNMIRIIVGTLVECGMHQRTNQSILDALESGDREQAGERAVAKGLYLCNTEY